MKAFAKRTRALLVAGALALSCAALSLFNLLPKTTELTASAASATYQFKNVATGETFDVSGKNIDRGSGCLVYYDSVWGSTHNNGTGTNKWGTELQVTLQGDKYVVTAKTVSDDNAGNMTIPENGFVLSGNSKAQIAKLDPINLGDELEFIDNPNFIAYNQTKGYETYITAKNQTSNGCATIWTSAYGTETPARNWCYSIVCAKAEGDHLYRVTAVNDQSGTAVPITIPAGGIVFDINGYRYDVTDSDGNITTPRDAVLFDFYNKTAIDDIIYFEDKNAVSLTPADITVKSGDLNLEVDGINPTAEQEIVGKSLIYTNMLDAYKTLDRTGETVKEYTVEKKGDAWEITGVASEGQTVVPDYNGFVLSIPSTVTGYDSLNEGDTVTLEGTFEQKTAFAANVTKNKKIFIDGANATRHDDQIILYDDVNYQGVAEDGGPEPEVGHTGTNQWGTEIQVRLQEGKYVVTAVRASGDTTDLEIPADGFVLSGNGTGAAALSLFEVGNEVHVYDRDVTSNTKVTSILNHGKLIDEFDPDTRDYNIIVYDGDPVPEITYTVQTRMGQTPTVNVNGIETAMGTVTIEVTAPDGTVGTYTLKFDRAYGTNRNLASVTVGGVALKEIETNMTVTVKPGELPRVEATPEDPRATVTVTQATAETKMATILVVADNTSLSKTYKITFVEANTSLASITIDGVALEGFSANTLSYTHTLAAGTQAAPVVAATAADSKATVSVEQAESATGTATINVTVDGITSTYTVQFQVAAGGNGNGGGNTDNNTDNNGDNTDNNGGNTDNNGNNNNNTGMIVGIVVGVVAAVAVAAGVTVFVVMKKKRGQNK